MTRMLVSLLTLGPPDQLTGGYLYHRRVADLAGAHGAAVEFVAVPVVKNPFAMAHGVVVVVDSIAAARVAMWRDPERRRPLAAIVHQPPGGIDRRWPHRTMQAVLDRTLYRRCDLVIAASDALKAALPVPARVAAPGCDAPASAPPEDLRRGRQVAFLSVGNWMARKGTLELLDAFARLSPGRATLHLAGRDDVEARYAARVHARLRRPDLATRVVWHGPISRAEVQALYAGADAFVLPSRREPYGTVYGEALAAGIPPVGWRAGNLPNLIEDGRSGVLVEPGDVAGLAAALDRLATDTIWRARLADGAAARGQALPAWADTAADLFGLLRGLTASAR
ncbi:MAG: glycosyltransferase family 4 protein [Acidimicrobiales bacterium]